MTWNYFFLVFKLSTSSSVVYFKRLILRAQKLDQQVKVRGVKLEDLSLISRTNIVKGRSPNEPSTWCFETRVFHLLVGGRCG